MLLLGCSSITDCKSITKDLRATITIKELCGLIIVHRVINKQITADGGKVLRERVRGLADPQSGGSQKLAAVGFDSWMREIATSEKL